MSNPTPITTMDAKAAKLLSKATSDALQAVAEQFGVTVQVGGGSFDPTAGTFKPKVIFAESGGAQREWARWAELFGLLVEDFGAEFTAQGRRFRITGVNTRAKRMPINCEEISTGRTFKFEAESVKRALATEQGSR
jgi:hypothetical protein